MQIRNLSSNTQRAYIENVARFARATLAGRRRTWARRRSAPIRCIWSASDSGSPVLSRSRSVHCDFSTKSRSRNRVLRRSDPRAEQAAPPSRRAQPRRSRPLSRVHHARRPPHDPDDVLRCGAACVGGRPPPTHRYRQPPHGDPVEQGKGQRDRIATSCFPRRFSSCCANGSAPTGRSRGCFEGITRQADHEPHRPRGVSTRASPIAPHQTGYPTRVAPCLRGPSPGSRDRCAHDSTAPGPSQSGDHRPLSADRHDEGLRDRESTRPEGLSALTTGESCRRSISERLPRRLARDSPR